MLVGEGVLAAVEDQLVSGDQAVDQGDEKKATKAAADASGCGGIYKLFICIIQLVIL